MCKLYLAVSQDFINGDIKISKHPFANLKHYHMYSADYADELGIITCTNIKYIK